MFSFKLEQFEGPLQLLLELIEAEKLEISTVALATVTDAYLQHLHAHPEIPPEELADFLVIASRLLFIKSQILLPYLNLGAEQDGNDLEAQLRIYKEYLDASKSIEALIGKRRFLFVHEKLPQVEIGFAPPEKLSIEAMVELFRAVIRRLEPLAKVPQAVLEKTMSITEKIDQIQKLISKAKTMDFRTLMASAETRTEIVVCFLALLEMVKQRSVTVSQDATFKEIMIAHV